MHSLLIPLFVLFLAGCAAPQADVLSAAKFRVILDPGHSPAKPGALACSGAAEERFNSALTASIAVEAEKLPTIAASLSRGYDSEMELLERVKGSDKADLFLSIHHDSVQPGDGTLRELNGSKRFCTDRASGFSLHLSRKNPHFHRSLIFARLLGKYLLAAGLKPNPYHGLPIDGENHPVLDQDLAIYAGDDLVVLKRSLAPAVLLEAGVIANPLDEEFIARADTRAAIAKVVAGALQEYRSGKGYHTAQ